ncbi:hypothetical protein BaRGS_00017541, partial [Batillaria attramentaria]
MNSDGVTADLRRRSETSAPTRRRKRNFNRKQFAGQVITTNPPAVFVASDAHKQGHKILSASCARVQSTGGKFQGNSLVSFLRDQRLP